MNHPLEEAVVGIIAEYNPFHNGHAYQIQKARELSGARYCVVVMSGDFVQRGAPAVFDKYTRTRMALLSGADLVLEIPPFFAASSAEDFAACGVAMLDRLGVVTHLCFGSECGEIGPIAETAQLLSAEPEELSSLIKGYIKQGLTYPQARAAAVGEYGKNEDCSSIPELLSKPNNILGIEYCKAIRRRGSSLIPITIKRQGNDYHEETLTSHSPLESDSEACFSSATSIRNQLRGNSRHDALKSHVPEAVWSLLPDARPLFSNDCSALLSYRILELERLQIPLEQFFDVSEELAARIGRFSLDFKSFDEKAAQLKTRQYTYTRISRSLIHILLHMTQAEYMARKSHDYISYMRLLGFRRDSGQLLSHIKKAADIPLITKTANAASRLTPDAWKEFQHDMFCSHVYQSLWSEKYHLQMRNEFTQSVIIV